MFDVALKHSFDYDDLQKNNQNIFDDIVTSDILNKGLFPGDLEYCM